MSGSSLKQEVLGFKMAQGHGAGGGEPTCQRRLDVRDTGSIPGGEDPLEEDLQYSCLGNPVNGSLVGYSPWDCQESDMT